jgi:hypothetical protein
MEVFMNGSASGGYTGNSLQTAAGSERALLSLERRYRRNNELSLARKAAQELFALRTEKAEREGCRVREEFLYETGMDVRSDEPPLRGFFCGKPEVKPD